MFDRVIGCSLKLKKGTYIAILLYQRITFINFLFEDIMRNEMRTS